jgi:uncharacterized membrane protein YphA (DoxX/SURF4 family)
MHSDTHAAPVSKSRLWGGRILTALPVLFLVTDAVPKLLKLAPVVEAFARLGLPVSLPPAIGILELVCVTLYVIPRTAVLGAVLLTAFLGGAMSLHVRIGDPLASHTLFPMYMGLMLWGGLFLREDRLRPLLPLRS